ncbi:MAG: tail fiber domain-containing protein, partial [Ilumatobacter sp.]|nr:tail fiber domain-containing protein [Ilumatobacter sp.]
DTIRLKENNLRLHFQDTSVGAFPTNDWTLVANSSASGGDSFFAIQDRDANRNVFRVDAGAPANALRVRSTGRVGIGEASPVAELHIEDGDTPTVRLEQDAAAGFTPQTWDVAGNEAGFFIRDATSGSTLPFRIRPGASSSMVDISGDDRVGIGTGSLSRSGTIGGADEYPSGRERLVIFDVDGDLDNDDNLNEDTDKVALFNSDIEVMGRIDVADRINVLGTLRVEGQATITDRLAVDYADPTGQVIRVRDNTSSNIMVLNTSGDLSILGTYGQISDVNRKDEIVAADTDAILEGVAGLPIAHWQYIADPDDATHLGPMAQDFAAAFGLGKDETTITTVDADGVALASIQALYHRTEAAQARIAELEAANADLAAANADLADANAALAARIARIEALLAADGE